MNEPVDLGRYARLYAESGIAVFPLWGIIDGPHGLRCACPKAYTCKSAGKHPRITPAHTPDDVREHGKCYGKCGHLGHGLYDATTDLDMIDALWADEPGCNIGMPALRNGYAILDIDPKSGGNESFERLHAYVLNVAGVDLMDTLSVRTGSGGMHLLYATPDGGIINKGRAFGADMLGIDTRGRGGYVVACPSLHLSGDRYEWLDIRDEPAPWPDILTALMHPPKVETAVVHQMRPRNSGDNRYAETALNRELEILRDAMEGTRNDTLNVAAFNLGTLVGAGALNEQTVRNELAAAASSIGLGFSEAEKTIRSGLSAGIASPRPLERAA